MRDHSDPPYPAGFHVLAAIAGRAIPFASSDGRTFVHIPVSRHGRRSLPLRSDHFRDWFFAQTYGDLDRIPTHQSFGVICRYLEAEARRSRDTTDLIVARRVFGSRDRIQIDLANSEGQFIDIDSHGHRVAAGADCVAFETSPSTGELPPPEPPRPDSSGGDSPLSFLRSLLRLGAPDSPPWLKCLAWLLAALRGTGPLPILVLRGPSASGKSVAARILRNLIDPCLSRLNPNPRSARELFDLARHHWVLVLDHLSSLSPGLCDAICRLSSGAALTIREPNRRDPVQLWLRRPILITVTDRFTLPKDLASRALIVDLDPLTPETCLTEEIVGDTGLQAHPQLLGALCDALSRALANRPKPVSTASRHADVLAWACAAFPDLAPQFRAAIEEPPPPHPVTAAIRRLLSTQPSSSWTGSATDLVKLIRMGPTPRALSAHLHNSVLDLADAGIDVQFRRLPGGARVIDLFASQLPPTPPQPPQKTPPTPPPEIPPSSGFCVTNGFPTAPKARTASRTHDHRGPSPNSRGPRQSPIPIVKADRPGPASAASPGPRGPRRAPTPIAKPDRPGPRPPAPDPVSEASPDPASEASPTSRGPQQASIRIPKPDRPGPRPPAPGPASEASQLPSRLHHRRNDVLRPAGIAVRRTVPDGAAEGAHVDHLRVYRVGKHALAPFEVVPLDAEPTVPAIRGLPDGRFEAGRVEHSRRARIRRDIEDVLVFVQNALPRLAGIGGKEDSAAGIAC